MVKRSGCIGSAVLTTVPKPLLRPHIVRHIPLLEDQMAFRILNADFIVFHKGGQACKVPYRYSWTDKRSDAQKRDAAVKQLIHDKDFEWKNDFIIEEDE